MTRDDPLPLLRTEREALADALQGLPEPEWGRATLCGAWTVQDIVTHLAAAARTPTLPWLANMLASRFDTDRHNQRLLDRHRSPDPGRTLAAFRASIPVAAAPFGAHLAALGEVVVHGQDIARPLGLPHLPSRAAARAVAGFFAHKDFAVNSATLVTGLRLEADDDEFTAGDGPVVRGPLLSLIMAMAGRPVVLEELEGEGVEALRARLTRG